jgi:aminopeptidase N
LLYLEKRKGIRAVETVLASYKTHLLAKTGGGNAVDSIGPIVWGPRLHNSQAPDGWRVVTYEKGSWIMHMLRQRMGEERFLAMLGQFRQRYQFQAVTTDQFRRAVAEGLPPKSLDAQLEAFFDQWVYGTGIPALKLSHKVTGKAPAVQLTATITQSDVAEDFSALVPVEIQVAKGKPLVRWVRTASEPVSFSVTLKQAPTKVLLDPNNSVLRK